MMLLSWSFPKLCYAVKEEGSLSHPQNIFLISQYYSGPGQHSSYSGLRAEWTKIWFLAFGQWQEIFLFSKTSRPILGAPAALYLGKSGPGMRLTTNLHLVLRLSTAIQTHPLCIHGICKEKFTLYPVLLHPGNQSQKWQNILVMGS